MEAWQVLRRKNTEKEVAEPSRLCSGLVMAGLLRGFSGETPLPP
jgi:hypothetical protein